MAFFSFNGQKGILLFLNNKRVQVKLNKCTKIYVWGCFVSSVTRISHSSRYFKHYKYYHYFIIVNSEKRWTKQGSKFNIKLDPGCVFPSIWRTLCTDILDLVEKFTIFKYPYPLFFFVLTFCVCVTSFYERIHTCETESLPQNEIHIYPAATNKDVVSWNVPWTLTEKNTHLKWNGSI